MTKKVHPFLALAVLLGASFAASAQETPPSFQVTLVDGNPRIGQLRELGAAGGLRLIGSNSEIQSTSWISMRRDNVSLPPHPRGPQIVFASGDRITLAEKPVVKIADHRLIFEPRTLTMPNRLALRPPLAAIALIWLGGPEGAEDPALLLRQLASDSHAIDLVMLRDGDRVEGVMESLDSRAGCQMTVGKRQVRLPWASIGAVAFRSATRTPLTPHGRYHHLILQDGSRLALVEARFASGGKAVTGKTAFDHPVEAPLSKVIALDVRGGQATYLSDMKPTKYDQIPFAGLSWPLILDGSVSGRELRLAGSTYDKGLGTHAECRVSFALAGKYRWFEARVGLDPDHGQRGRVKLCVLVDGKPRDLGWNKELTARDPPLTLRVDVHKGRELTLEVLSAGFGDVQAHVNWADARLIE